VRDAATKTGNLYTTPVRHVLACIVYVCLYAWGLSISLVTSSVCWELRGAGFELPNR